LAAKRSHIDEDGRGDKRPEIDRHDTGQSRSAGSDIEHLPGLKHAADLGVPRKNDGDLAAETNYLDSSCDIRNQKIRSRDRRGDRSRLHLASSRAFRRGK
jgi:hypothetical protein